MRTALVVALFVFLVGCGDECTEYSEYNCKQLAKADYNVYVYLNGNEERYAGVATGLDGCADLADDYADSQNERITGRNYVCCLKTADSSCAEKHR